MAAADARHPHDLVVIGASAGGVEALSCVVAGLPAGLPAAVCVVLHLSAATPSALPGILDRVGPLPCRHAQDGDTLTPGTILVAPPDRHLVIDDGHVRLTAGPRENNHRPSIDTLFRSAAETAGERVVGVVLSGMQDDGTAGLGLIKAAGGVALVQSPQDALHPAMPNSAIDNVEVDDVLACTALGPAIAAAAGGARDVRRPAPDPPPEGDPLTLVCPECGGVLSETTEGGVPRWRCHVGHVYSPEALTGAQGISVERALWTAERLLRDRAALLRRLAEQADGRAHDRSAARFRRRAADVEAQAESLQSVLGASATLLETATMDEDVA